MDILLSILLRDPTAILTTGVFYHIKQNKTINVQQNGMLNCMLKVLKGMNQNSVAGEMSLHLAFLGVRSHSVQD